MALSLPGEKEQDGGGEFDSNEQKRRGGGAEDGDEEHSAKQGTEAGPGVIGADDAPGRGWVARVFRRGGADDDLPRESNTRASY